MSRRRRSRPVSRSRQVLRDLCAVVAIGLAVFIATPPDRRDPWRVAFVSALVFAVFLTRRLVGEGSRPAIAARADRDPHPAGAEHLTQIARLTGSLEAGSSSRAKFDLTVRPLLYRVAAERLLSRHGVDLRRDADAPVARARLGDDLWQLFAATGRPAYDDPPPTLDEVRQWISAVERI